MPREDDEWDVLTTEWYNSSTNQYTCFTKPYSYINLKCY